MVGPSISDDDRRSFLLKFRVGFALLVGASMALVSLQGTPSLAVVAGAAVAGTAVGAVLAWWVFPDSIALGYASDGGNRRRKK